MNSGRHPGEVAPRSGHDPAVRRVAPWSTPRSQPGPIDAMVPMALAMILTAFPLCVPVEAHAAESAAARAKPAETTAGARTGDMYWIQVGAFRDGETAARVVQRLRAQKYSVHESVITRQPEGSDTAPVAPAAPTRDDRYEVVVTGGSPTEVSAQLTAKGLTSRSAAEGAVITPGLSLGEAVALSKDLSREGMSVRVRRIDAVAAVPPRGRSAAARETLHRIRVGSFTDRAAAEAALKDLKARGYRPVLTRGNE